MTAPVPVGPEQGRDRLARQRAVFAKIAERYPDPTNPRRKELMDKFLQREQKANAPPAEGRDFIRNATTGLAAVARGGTLGLSDQAGAAISAALPEWMGGSGASYKENLAAIRGDAKEAPVIAGAGELAGAVAGGIATPFTLTGRMAAKLGLTGASAGLAGRIAKPIARAGMEGAAQGATSAALSGDITDPDALKSGAVRGGVAGGVLGSALQAALPVAGGVVRGAGAIARNVGEGVGRAMNTGADAVAASRGASAMTDELADLAARSAGAPAGGGAPPVRPLRAMRGEVSDPRGTALELMAADLRAGGNDPADILRRLEAGEIPESLNVTPLELGGSPVRRTADVSTIASKEADAVLLPRLGERQSRIAGMASESLERASGQPREEGFAVLRQMMDERKAKAEPAYAAAYAHGPITRPRAIERVNELLKMDPVYRDAYAMARRIAAQDGKVLPKLDMGDGQLAELPTVEALDTWKKGLDAFIEAKAGSEGAVPKNLARLVRRNLNDVLAMVDDEVPAYGAARKEFGDESAIIEAFEAGRDVSGQKVGELSETLADLPAMAKDAYKRGVLVALQDEIEAKGPNALLGARARGTDIVNAVFGNGKQRKRYEAALGPDEVRRLVDEYVTLADMGLTNREVGKGSQTARRLAGDIPAMDEAVSESMAASPTSPMQAALRAVLGGARVGANAATRKLTPDVATQYGILSGVGAGAGERSSLTQLIRDVMEREAIARQRAIQRTGQTGAVAGRLAGGMVQ